MVDFKKTAKKVWQFIWHENSVWSWIVNIILAFILIKFIIYPGLGLAFGTNYPVVAVVSSSMEHDTNFNDWWDSRAICDIGSRCSQGDWYFLRNITRTDFDKFPFKNGFNKGDIMVLVGVKPENIKIGDIIVYNSGKPYPIIHRVVYIADDYSYFQTKGDHNVMQISDVDLNEMHVNKTQLLGRAILKVPWLGWVKIGFVDFFQWLFHLF